MTLQEQGAPNARLLLGALVAAGMLLAVQAGPARGQSVSISETQAFTPNPVYVNGGGGANFLATATPAPGTTITQTNYTWIITEKDYRTAANLAWTVTNPNTQFSAGQGATLSSNLATGGYYQFTIKCTVVMTTTTGAHETASQTLLVPDILTVVQINSVTGTIDSTPSNTLRSPNTGNPASRPYTSSAVSGGWQSGGSLVLIQNSMTSVPLTVNMLPTDYAPSWVSVPDPDGNPAGSVNLTLGGTTGLTNTVALNSYGAYSVVCYFDANGDGVFDTTPAPADHGVYWNVVVVHAEIVNTNGSTLVPNPESISATQGTYTRDNTIAVTNQIFLQLAMGTPVRPAITFSGTVWVNGGGPQGVLGLDRVGMGWLSNVSSSTVAGSYDNAHTAGGFLPNIDVKTTAIPDYITQALPDADYAATSPPISAAAPVLDTPSHTPATGGGTVCLSGSACTDLNGPPPGFTGGDGLKKLDIDAPALPMAEKHPNPSFNGTFYLRELTLNSGFTEHLIIWTGVTATTSHLPSTSDPGAALYTCCEDVPWAVSEKISNITWDANDNPTALDQAVPSISVGNPVDHTPAVRIETVHGETTTPAIQKRTGLYDASK